MAVTLKGRTLTVTGKDAKLVEKYAKLHGITPKQELINIVAFACAKAKEIVNARKKSKAPKKIDKTVN